MATYALQHGDYLPQGLNDTQSQARLWSGPLGKHLVSLDLVQRRCGGKEEIEAQRRGTGQGS